MEGLFTTPEEVRNAEIAKLQQRGAGLSYLGGSQAGLLGQIAASGGITGAALGGMMNRSGAERKAANIHDVVKSIDFENFEDVKAKAQMLNQMGYAKEAMSLLDKGRDILVKNASIEDAEFARNNRTRQISYAVPYTRMVTGADGYTQVPVTDYRQLTVTEIYDNKTKQWVPARKPPANAIRQGEVTEGADSEIPEIEIGDVKLEQPQAPAQATPQQDVTTQAPTPAGGTPMPSVFDNPVTGIPQATPQKLEEAQRIMDGLSEAQLGNMRKAYDQYKRITTKRYPNERVMSFSEWLFDMIMAGRVR